MSYIFDLEGHLRMVLPILTSMGFDVNLIRSITYNVANNTATFLYKGGTTWQVDLKYKKQRYKDNDEWTDWVYM